jgi:LacI family transcriptional regulator
MAAAAMAVAHRGGLDVPKDISIAGFDDTPLATMISPHLTTIRRPVSEMAYRSVKLLVDEVQDGRVDARKPARREILKYALLPRGSSGPR